ncbi:hypothetical protein TIFTF001_027083 [Ficus carica]|uniref:RNase H type-1 domain-containing protein n=1 Tax=Ficus carica TaxID=3494 RepID=A0AA88DMQ6_FICCA|nr:hypothetical protein TIFTF001_027083 [Ficus carica]
MVRNQQVFESRLASRMDILNRAGRVLGEYLLCNRIDITISSPTMQPVPRRTRLPYQVLLRVQGSFPPFLAGCLAAREGTRLVASCGFQNWVLESGAVNVVKAILSPASSAPEASVIDDIREVISQANSTGSVCYGPRQGNSLAHAC